MKYLIALLFAVCSVPSQAVLWAYDSTNQNGCNPGADQCTAVEGQTDQTAADDLCTAMSKNADLMKENNSGFPFYQACVPSGTTAAIYPNAPNPPVNADGVGQCIITCSSGGNGPGKYMIYRQQSTAQISMSDGEDFTSPANTYQNVTVTLSFVGDGNTHNATVVGEDFLGSGSYWSFTADPVIKDAYGNVVSTSGSCLGHPASWCYYRNRYNYQQQKVSAAAFPTVSGEWYTITVQGQFTDTVTPAHITTFEVNIH